MKMRSWPCFLVVGALSGCSGETIDAGANAPDSGGNADGAADRGVTIASGIQLPPLHLLSDGTTLFWTDEGGGLSSMPVGGGAVTALGVAPASVPITLLAVDAANFYLELGNSGIYRTSRAVGGSSVLISDPADTAFGMATVTIGPATVLGGTAYWSEQEGSVDGGLSSWLLKSVPLQGGPVTLIAQLPPGGPAVTAIGVTTSTVYLAGPSATLLGVVPMSTGTPTSAGLARGCSNLVSDTDAVYCYLSGSVGPIQRFWNTDELLDLGVMIDMSTSPSVALAVDDANLYWVDDTTIGTITKVPKPASTTIGPAAAATVIAHDTSPIAIAVDATSVYWSNVGGEIRRAPK
jgi:hypothetical protein